jgi:hypothetical protein
MTENRTSVLLQTASRVLVMGAGLVTSSDSSSCLFSMLAMELLISVFPHAADFGRNDFHAAALAIFLTFSAFTLWL